MFVLNERETNLIIEALQNEVGNLVEDEGVYERQGDLARKDNVTRKIEELSCLIMKLERGK